MSLFRFNYFAMVGRSMTIGGNSAEYVVSWFLGFLVSWFLGCWFLGFLVSGCWFRGFLISWCLVSTFLGLLVSKFQSFRNMFNALLEDIDPILPTYYFVFPGRDWSHIQDFKSCFKD